MNPMIRSLQHIPTIIFREQFEIVSSLSFEECAGHIKTFGNDYIGYPSIRTIEVLEDSNRVHFRWGVGETILGRQLIATLEPTTDETGSVIQGTASINAAIPLSLIGIPAILFVFALINRLIPGTGLGIIVSLYDEYMGLLLGLVLVAVLYLLLGIPAQIEAIHRLANLIEGKRQGKKKTTEQINSDDMLG